MSATADLLMPQQRSVAPPALRPDRWHDVCTSPWPDQDGHAPPRIPPDVIPLSEVTAARMAGEWYEYASAEHFWFQWRFAVLRDLLPAAGPAAPMLEIGCGNGVARGQIEEAYGCRVDACDINVEALRQGPAGGGQRYLYNVHDRRPAWRGHFSTVFLLDALEHISAAPDFLESVAYHLAPGGTLVITVPAGQWIFSKYDRIVGHVKRYSASLLRMELAAAGLRLIRHQYWGLPLLPVLVARKAVLACTRRPAVVRTGFQPASALVDWILRGLMRVERRFLPRPAYGAALVGLARRAAPG